LTLFGQGCRIELRPLEVGVALLSSGERIPLSLDDVDQRFKPGIYAQDRFFMDVCLGKRLMASPAASLHEALVTMELAEVLLGEADWIPE